MFERSKRRIVFAIVFSLLALMTVTLTTIYVSNLLTIRRENEEMLETFANRFVLGGQADMPKGGERPSETDRPPEMPDNGRNERNDPAFRLSTFYSVAYSSSGEVIDINNGEYELQTEETLLNITSSALKSGKRTGRIGNLTYLVTEKEGYTLVSVLDGTINDNNQRKLFFLMLGIGGGALVILFVISVFIARKIVKPMEENDKKQKQFVSDAGHELKTPIAVISANTELLKRELGDNEWLSNIDYENEKMSELIKQLLSLSHAENDNIPKEKLDFSKLVVGEVLPFESFAFEKGKKIELDVENEIFLQGNRTQLRQLVSILIDNALSHGIGDSIKVSLKKEKRLAVLSVSNGATEITEEKLSHLFDRFYRADESRNDKGSHYGLGLSIAKAVTDGHGGNIRAEYNGGTITFTAVFPDK